jgi:hypothetical protein
MNPNVRYGIRLCTLDTKICSWCDSCCRDFRARCIPAQNQRHNGNMRVPLVELFDQKPEQLGRMSRPESADPLPKDSLLSNIHVGALLFD